LTKMTCAVPFQAVSDTVRSEGENIIVQSEQNNNTARTKEKGARSIDQIQKSNKTTKLSMKEKVLMG